MAAARKFLDRVMNFSAHQLLLMTRSHRGAGGSMISRPRYIFGGTLFRQLQLRPLNVPPTIDEDEVEEDDDEDGDFLGAEKLGKKFLVRSWFDHNYDDKQQLEQVPIDSLRGKIVGLYFESGSLYSSPVETRVTCAFREFYNTLKQTKPDSFEMIYVPPFPPKHHDQNTTKTPLEMLYLPPRRYDLEAGENDLSVHNAMISTLPWLSIPVDDLHWRSYLHQLYFWNPCDFPTDITFFDTRNNKVEIVPDSQPVDHIYCYGPQYYPFTEDRVDQLQEQSEQLAKETSIQAILGSSSRDYLIDRHSNKVPISSLDNKDVLLFGYSSHPTISERRCLEQLLEIYNKLRNNSCEIVSINFDYNGGTKEKQKLWKDHLAQIPWLSLPFGDEKIWPLRNIARYILIYHNNDPVLFVKPKGESLLDPYGYRMLKTFGIQAFPYSRMGAAEYLVKKLKGLSFKSYVDEAGQLGLDFDSLIRNTAEGGIEHVSLSTILEGKVRSGILLLFASSGFCSQERIKSLISVYRNSQNESSSSFEVIFVSMDKDTPSFNEYFSSMPWFAFQRPIKREELMKLAKRTTNIDFNGFSHFLAFGPDQLLLQAGMITKSFENCEFPFINDAESAKHVAFRITRVLELEMEADGTPCYEGDGWWSDIEFTYGPGIDARCFPDFDNSFYDDYNIRVEDDTTKAA